MFATPKKSAQMEESQENIKLSSNSFEFSSPLKSGMTSVFLNDSRMLLNEILQEKQRFHEYLDHRHEKLLSYLNANEKPSKQELPPKKSVGKIEDLECTFSPKINTNIERKNSYDVFNNLYSDFLSRMEKTSKQKEDVARMESVMMNKSKINKTSLRYCLNKTLTKILSKLNSFSDKSDSMSIRQVNDFLANVGLLAKRPLSPQRGRQYNDMDHCTGKNGTEPTFADVFLECLHEPQNPESWRLNKHTITFLLMILLEVTLDDEQKQEVILGHLMKGATKPLSPNKSRAPLERISEEFNGPEEKSIRQSDNEKRIREKIVNLINVFNKEIKPRAKTILKNIESGSDTRKVASASPPRRSEFQPKINQNSVKMIKAMSPANYVTRTIECVEGRIEPTAIPRHDVLYLNSKYIDQKNQHIKAILSQQDSEDCTFVPKINKKKKEKPLNVQIDESGDRSRKHTGTGEEKGNKSKFDKLYEAAVVNQKKRDEKHKFAELRRRQREMEQCTFSPKIDRFPDLKINQLNQLPRPSVRNVKYTVPEPFNLASANSSRVEKKKETKQLQFDVTVSAAKKGKLVIKESDDPEFKVRSFSQVFGLSPEAEENLRRTVLETLRGEKN